MIDDKKAPWEQPRYQTETLQASRFTLTHRHNNGVDIHEFLSSLSTDAQPDGHMIARILDIEYEPHRDEGLELVPVENYDDTPDLRDLIDEFKENNIDQDWALKVVEDENAPEYWKVVDPDGWTIKTWFNSEKNAQEWADEQMKILTQNSDKLKEVTLMRSELKYDHGDDMDVDYRNYKFLTRLSENTIPSSSVVLRMMNISYDPRFGDSSTLVVFDGDVDDSDDYPYLEELIGQFTNNEVAAGWRLEVVEEKSNSEDLVDEKPASKQYTVVDTGGQVIKPYFSSKKGAEEWADDQMKRLGLPPMPKIQLSEIVTDVKIATTWPENLPENYIFIQGKNAAGQVVIGAPFHADELKDALGEDVAQGPWFMYDRLEIPCDPENLILGDAESKAVVGRLEATRFVNCIPFEGAMKVNAFTASGKWLFSEMYQDHELASIYGQDLANHLIANNGGSYTDLSMRITSAMLNEDSEEEQTAAPGV